MISKPEGRERTGSGRVIYETPKMSNSKLYVGNMSFKTTEDELRQAFGQFGSVTDVYVAMDKMTGRPRGFAFVTMGTADEAKSAAEKLNGTDRIALASPLLNVTAPLAAAEAFNFRVTVKRTATA